MSPMTWLSICRVRLTPRIPKTTNTMAPVSTRGRTAGFPQLAFPQGLKPEVADSRALGKLQGKEHRGENLKRLKMESGPCLQQGVVPILPAIPGIELGDRACL